MTLGPDGKQLQLQAEGKRLFNQVESENSIFSMFEGGEQLDGEMFDQKKLSWFLIGLEK